MTTLQKLDYCIAKTEYSDSMFACHWLSVTERTIKAFRALSTEEQENPELKITKRIGPIYNFLKLAEKANLFRDYHPANIMGADLDEYTRDPEDDDCYLSPSLFVKYFGEYPGEYSEESLMNYIHIIIVNFCKKEIEIEKLESKIKLMENEKEIKRLREENS